MMKCVTTNLNIGYFFVGRDSFDLDPEYQRQAGVWGEEKQQLFLHTIFADYDVPKIYISALPENDGLHEHAIVDGKQRLQCIWDFLDNKIKLGDAHKGFVPNGNAQKTHKPFPSVGDYYKDLSFHWQEQFKSTNLSVVIIENADEQDIEALFSRLNNGEPLNAAELRNAMGGNMRNLINEVAEHKFFTEVLPIRNRRYQHLDIAARFLLIEEAVIKGDEGGYCTLKKRFLDDLVEMHKDTKEDDIKKRHDLVKNQLDSLCEVFSANPELLKKAGYPQLYYLFVKAVQRLYKHERLIPLLSAFLKKFAGERADFLRLQTDEKIMAEYENSEEYERLIHLEKFERLMGQGNDKLSLKERVSIMIRFFLQENYDVQLTDIKRTATNAERYILYVQGGKKCVKCECSLNAEFGEFEPDHVVQWVQNNGKAVLKDAQVFCAVCNAAKNLGIM